MGARMHANTVGKRRWASSDPEGIGAPARTFTQTPIGSIKVVATVASQTRDGRAGTMSG